MIKYPILYDKNMMHKGVIYADILRVSLAVRPLSVANISAPYDTDIQIGDFVQVFFPDNTWQYFRVQNTANEIGGLITAQLEHSIVWAEDFLLPDKQDGLIETPRQVLERFFTRLTNTKWRLGVVEATEKIEIDFDFPNVMQGLIDVLELCKGYTYTFDQTGDTWLLNLVKLPETVSCEGRISRNLITRPQIAYNTDEMCTRVYVSGKDWHIDADNIGEIGVIERTITLDTKGVDDEELKQKCREYLEKHKTPSVSIVVDAHELSGVTGETFDNFSEGSICRLCLVDYGGIVITERITNRIYPDILRSPHYVQLQIASKLPDVSSQINGIIVTQKKITDRLNTELHDVYSGIEEIDERLTTVYNEVWVELDAQRAEIDLKATSAQVNEVSQRVNEAFVSIEGMEATITSQAQSIDILNNEISSAVIEINGMKGTINLKADKTIVDGLGERLSAAEINIDGTNSTITALSQSVDSLNDSVSSAQIEINGMKGEISSKVSKNGIISEINQSAESILINAGRINLSGYVTAETLETEVLRIMEYAWANEVDVNSLVASSVNTESLSADSITSDSVSTSELTVGSKGASWKSQYFLTSVSKTEHKDVQNVMLAGGGTAVINFMTGVQVSTDGKTIYYLGSDS